MKIQLRKAKVLLDENKKIELDNVKFAKLVEGSFYEYTKNENNFNKLHWEAEFFIETEEGDFNYKVDTKGQYITSIDLDGCLEGEKIDLDDDMELLLSAKHSYIYEVLIFHELKKLKIISDLKLKAVELALFPHYANGYIADDLENNSNIKEFREIFTPLFSEFEIVKKIEIQGSNPYIQCKDENIKILFKKFLLEYVKENLFFILYDKTYGELLPKQELNQLISAGKKFNPDLSEVELYS
jgi:hypothetical protein